MTALYTDGTITLVNGSPIITGIDTAWKVSNIVGGTVFVEVDGGSPLPILPDDGDAENLHPIKDTQMTAAIKWTGPSGTYDYAIVRETSYNRQQAVNAEKLGDLLSQLDAPLLAALSSVEGLQDHLILLTGASTLSLIPRTSLLEGVKRDQTVNTIADLATYSGEVKDFAVLVANAGDGRAAIFVKRSNADGDWSDPVYITGAEGDTGAAGPYTEITVGPTTTLPAGSSATVTPVILDADTIRLDFGLPKGLDGTGTGDVVGPASSVANRVAVFGGTSGKVIIDSGVTLGNSASRNVGTAAGTVAAGDDPRFSAGGQNEAILALTVADLQGRALGLKGGVADAFDDETGVDVKTNATYDAANDSYLPAVSGGATSYSNAGGGGNRSASIVVTSSFTFTGGAVSTFVDGNTANNAVYIATTQESGYIQFDFGAGNAKYIDELTIYQVASFLGAGPWTWSGSNDGVSFTTLQSGINLGSGAPAVVPIAAHATTYRYFRLSTTSRGSGSGYINEFNFKIASSAPSPQNMTLRSIAYAAAFVPTTGRVAIQLVETDAITINTDVVVRMSRDGGATWATASLALSQSLIGPKMYEATGFNLASLGSGTSMKWEITTANGKNVAVSGVVAQWS